MAHGRDVEISIRRDPGSSTRPHEYSIDASFRAVFGEWSEAAPRTLFSPSPLEESDPLLVSMQSVSLSKLLDLEYERQYETQGATKILSGIFRKLRGN